MIAVDELYTMSPDGGILLRSAAGTIARLLALAGSASCLSIGLALLGAYGMIFNVGDWGWLIGAGAASFLYCAMSAVAARTVEASAGE